MKETADKVMAFCDPEEEYARLMVEFMHRHKSLPWEIHMYTNAADLLKEEKGLLEIAVVAESAYCQEINNLSSKCLVVLNESGLMRWEGVSYVDKYQKAEEVLKSLLGFYAEVADVPYPRLGRSRKTVFIGIYSPVKRCLQTSFAVTMAQMLAMEHPVLYLNFEYYAGIGELLADMKMLDLADLLYFLHGEKDKFRLRLQTILKRMGGLDYIPPMKSGQNLLSVTAYEWIRLIQNLETLGVYEYIVLDLSDNVQGLFEILRTCARIYTLTREDRIARSKMLQYQQVLELYEYGDVLEKTYRLNLANIRRLPEEMEQLTRSDLADVVGRLLKDMELEAKKGGGDGCGTG